MKTILSYLSKKDRLFLILAIAISLGSIYTDMAIPNQMNRLTEMIHNKSSEVSDVAVQGAWMVGYAFLGLILTLLMMYLSAKVGTHLAMQLRGAVFDKTLSFSMKEMGQFSPSSLITRCTLDITRIQTVFAIGSILIFKAPITAIWAFSRILGKNMWWSISTGAILLVVILFLVFVIIGVIPLVNEMQKDNDRLSKISRENILGIRVIHAFNAFKYQQDRFDVENAALTDVSKKVSKRTSIFAPFLDAASNFLNIAIYGIGAIVIGSATVGERIGLFSDMVTFSSYALLVMAAFIQLLIVYVALVRCATSVKRVSEVLNCQVEIKDGLEQQEITKSGTIEFRHVSFRYPNTKENALSDINISINKGETVAFIGATGSGKTTLLNLILRFYDVDSGDILVDGRDVRDYKLKDLRNRLGYIPQKSTLFSGTIASNIAYGDNGRFKATLREVIKAAKVGQASEFIEQKEGSYSAKVSEGGRNFSGGQKQRLTISRAIAREPEIYIFDDSFSALDYKTDKRLRQSLKETAKEATVLIVAQRIGTIRNADKIYVIDKGRIVGEGRHDDLMTSCDIYKEIALSQLSESEA